MGHLPAPVIAVITGEAGGAGSLANSLGDRILVTEHGLFVSYHCRFPGSQTVEAVHEAVDGLEDALRKKLPEVRRVIAHAEPIGRAPH